MRAGLAALFLAGAIAASGEDLETTARSEWIFSLGYGHTVQFVARAETSDHLVLFQPQWGLRLGAVVEYLAAAHVAGYLGDANGWFLGILPIGARFELPRSAWRPYFTLQAGFGWTNLDIIELDRRFNFILTGGFGLRWPKRRPDQGLLEVRLVHYSNAGTVLPNLGLNSISLVVGWRIR